MGHNHLPATCSEESVWRRGQCRREMQPKVRRSSAEAGATPTLGLVADRDSNCSEGESSPIAHTTLRATTSLHATACCCPCTISSTSASDTLPHSNAPIASNAALLAPMNPPTSTRQPLTLAKPYGALQPSRALSSSHSLADASSINQSYASGARARKAEASALDEKMWMAGRGWMMEGVGGGKRLWKRGRGRG